MRPIDADALLKRINYKTESGLGKTIAFTFKHFIDDAPTIETHGDSISRAEAKQQISEWATIITNPALLDKDATMVVLDALPSAYTVPGEWYEDAVKANHGLVKENSELKEQLESASDAYMRGFDDCKRAYEIELARSADAKAHEEEHLNIINRVKELQYAIAKTQTIVGKMVESAEAEQGEWIRVGHDIYECSLCHQNVMTKDIDCYSYCHRCGARMTPYKGGDDE